MSLKRTLILFERELVRGPKSFIVIFAILAPLLISLVVSLVFGNLFAGKPKLGLVAEGNSQFVSMAREVDSLILRQYASDAELREAVQRGAVDVGMALPAGFDASLRSGQTTRITAYIWGESLLKNRAVLVTTIGVLLRQLTGQEPPVQITTATVGEGESVPWEDRLLPFIVMMTMLIGGIMVPATSVVDEKQKRTLKALAITPATLNDVFAAKGLLGVLLSVFSGVLILLLNRAFGSQPLLLVGLLALGAVMASAIGLILGAFVKDINTLFATIKSLGILLYAPAIVYLFPTLPQWIGKIFPTYYMIGPVIDVTQNGATLGDILPEIGVLLALIVLLIVAVGMMGKRLQVQET